MSAADLYASLPGVVPIDSDGFVIDFEATEFEQIQSFFQRYGFVVIRNSLTAAACEATLNEFFENFSTTGLRREDPETWGKFWDQQRFRRFGIVGSFPELFSVAQLTNRCSPAVHKAFAAVYGTEDLWVDHDRLGIMAPTRFSPNEIADWETIRDWLHLDCNPVSADNGRRGYASIGGFQDDQSSIDFRTTLIIQGLLTLTDARIEDGGFHCVPGSHKICMSWAAMNQNIEQITRENMQVPINDPIRKYIQKIPIRRGCLLAWTSLLMHGNHPNKSANVRAVQYIRMLPKGTPYSPLESNEKAFPKKFIMTRLARKLLGIE